MPPSLLSTSQRLIVQIGPASYLVRNRIEYEFPPKTPPPATTPTPVVVITLENSPVSLESITRKFSIFEAEDDVFNDEFTSGGFLILQQHGSPPPAPTLPHAVTEFLNTRLTTVLLLNSSLPEGPYFAVGRNLHQAWRLYADELSAFSTAVLPQEDHEIPAHAETSIRYEAFHAAAFGDSVSCVPVPSRLYFRKTKAQPLAGLRITVKDNMHLAGVVTGLGNKAYAQLYGKQEATAKFIDSLVKKGAVIVGKTKLSAFAGSEIPPNQCVDYFPPWNARGDGYQGPSGSSSGAASSIAGYPWVDISLCTDTSGSLRHPASSHGAWGHRITWGALSMDGIVPAVPVYDNIGLLTRTPEKLQELLVASQVQQKAATPKRLIYPTDWFPVKDKSQQWMNEAFLVALEQYLGIQHTKVSLVDEWVRTAPEEFRGMSLNDFLGTSANSVNGYYAFHSFDDFRRDYPVKFGKQPYISPAHTERWQRGSKISIEDRDRSLERITIFKKWFDKAIWKIEEDDNTAIMIVPQGRPGANYRDVVGEPAGGGMATSYTPILTTSMIGCPQLVVPIGQNPYHSRVSDLDEYAPIMSSLIGPANSDKILVDVARGALEQAGWPTHILTGRFMFALGDNERHATVSPKEKL